MMNSSNLLKSSNIIFLNEFSSIGKWQREQTIGSGSLAIVTIWVNTETNQRIALKQNRNYMEFNPKKISYYKEKWREEIKMMKQIKCENIVKALQVPKEFASLPITMPILAMEYCSGGDLRKVLNQPHNCCGLSEQEVMQVLKHISSAIIYLHDLNIIHRDLKPENIVLQPMPYGKIVYKLTDLGYAKQVSDSILTSSFVGTLEYLAPELFLNVKYSSAVDNWSFGLLAYEIITGQRPFFPNNLITDALEELKKKKSEICTEMDSQGNFYFSSEISSLNYISNILKTDLEQWLRIVLEYDPEKRGGRKALQMIHQIMNKYKVQIFLMNSYETFSYEIDPETKLDDLKRKISTSTETISSNQYLLFQNGDIPNPKIGQQIIETWYKPESWFERYNPIVIFMFDYSKQLEYQEFYKSIVLPTVVKNMLLNTEIIEYDYDELKLAWRSSVFVARQIVIKHILMHNALKSCILHCVNIFNKLQNENQILFNSINEIFSAVNVLKKFFKSNHSKYKMKIENVSNDHKKVSNSLKIKILPTFINKKILHHLENSQQIVPKFDKEMFLFEDFFQSPEFKPLMNKFIDIQNAYVLLRKMTKEEFDALSSKNLMLKLLCDCFQLVETFMDKIIKSLSILIEFIKKIDILRNHCRQFQKEIDQRKCELEELYQTPSCKSEDIEQLILKLEPENSLWKNKIFNFNKLDFHNFLF